MNNQELIELKSDDLKKIDGGFWGTFALVVGIISGVGYIYDNRDKIAEGFNEGRAAAAG